MRLTSALCEHFDYTRSELVAVIGIRQIRGVRGILARYGKGSGGNCCIPAIAEMLRELESSRQMRDSALKAALRPAIDTQLECASPAEQETPAVRDLLQLLNSRYAAIRRAYPLRISVSVDRTAVTQVSQADIGIVIHDEEMDIFVCGQGGSSHREGHLLARTGLTDATRILDRFLMYYIMTADPFTGTAPWCDTLEDGANHLRNVVVFDKLRIGAELDESFLHLAGGCRGIRNADSSMALEFCKES